MFKSNYTKWIPFGNYEYAATEYMVFVRKNTKTGMLQFETKRIQSRLAYHTKFVPKLIDVQKAFDEITHQ